jgi:hypothetical protein
MRARRNAAIPGNIDGKARRIFVQLFVLSHFEVVWSKVEVGDIHPVVKSHCHFVLSRFEGVWSEVEVGGFIDIHNVVKSHHQKWRNPGRDMR